LAAGEQKPSTGIEAKVGPDFSKEPTFVKADSLTLLSEKREFTYSGNVELKHGDMTLTAAKLVGNYGEDNQIKDLVATGDVVIIKGESMRGTCQRAKYDALAQTVVLLDSPELQEKESVLVADTITIFLKEDRSVAEGQVRVKLVKSDDKQEKK
jgi:lipopolysaccharide export system protein LptA